MKAFLAILLALFAAQAFAGDTLPAPIQALQSHGLVIRGELPAPAGFKGYLAQYKNGNLPVYLLPDGKHVVVGNLFDAQGRDLTRDVYAKAVREHAGDAVWKALANSTWIAEGAKQPKRVVYVLSDTECKYCHNLWTKVEPLLVGGSVQVRYVMVAVISDNSLGRAAAILTSKDPAAALRRHEANFGHSPYAPMKHVPDPVQAQIEANNSLMAQMGVSGTPAIIFKDANGKLQVLGGMPDSDALLDTIFGS